MERNWDISSDEAMEEQAAKITRLRKRIGIPGKYKTDYGSRYRSKR